ncbi:LasR-specific antiactivator QslA [Pseudomonas sp. Marseille-Q8238]
MHPLLERQLFPPGAQRHAFELAFLSRIHQRLCSPIGGGHLARRTELQL